MKVIVLVPVKNEEWILEKFLTITSLFADHIIILDQNSTDASKEIASRFEKVFLFENKTDNYSEAYRQNLLIQKARELFGIGNFLLAIDADEIIRADSIDSDEWDIIREAPLGTVFRFDKPTPLFDEPFALTYPNGFPLGYKDDGAEHKAIEVHSTRIPVPDYAKQVLLPNIGFLHLCFVRHNIQFSKNRYYCALENIKQSKSLRLRRLFYSYYTPAHYFDNNVVSLNNAWYTKFDNMGIDLKNFKEQPYYYMDFEVVKLLQNLGTKKFLKDPIWHFDWEKCRKEGLRLNYNGIKDEPIKTPSFLVVKYYDALFYLIGLATKLKRNLSK